MWFVHKYCSWILLSRIPDFFHQIIYCLFWSPQNIFWIENQNMQYKAKITIYFYRKAKNKSRKKITCREFTIRENKIREAIWWADHCSILSFRNWKFTNCSGFWINLLIIVSVWSESWKQLQVFDFSWTYWKWNQLCSTSSRSHGSKFDQRFWDFFSSLG